MGPKEGKRQHQPKVQKADAGKAAAEQTAAEPGHHPHHGHPVSTDFLSHDQFATHPLLSDAIKNAIQKGFGYANMSRVQATSIPLSVEGHDVLAKAQTGTGKTLAFLIPSLELVLKCKRDNSIKVVIVSPTRELAMQINDECENLTDSLRGIRSICVYGGTKIQKDRSALSKPVDILVATPGRFCDHIQTTDDFGKKLQGVKCLVLDEADRMLDMGFRPDIEKILAALPTKRQTLLFSATVPEEIVRIAPKVLAAEFLFCDAKTGDIKKATTTGTGKLIADDPMATVAQVEQDCLLCPLKDQMNIVFDFLAIEQAKKDHKIIVFFTTARIAQLYAEVSQAMGLNTLEIHSRKSQAQRQKASDRFKDGTNVTMFSSDVTARGLDYPDVTYVLQVSAPTDTEQYIHRLGRTARAGKKGRGTLVLIDEERYYLNNLKKLPLKDAAVPPQARWKITPDEAVLKVSRETKGCAYAAWLGFYNGMCSRMKWSKERLVKEANYFATTGLQLPSPPPLQKKTIGKMGLKGVPGLVIEGAENPSFKSARGGNEGGRGGGGGRGGNFAGDNGRGRGGANGQQGGKQQSRFGNDAPSAPSRHVDPSAFHQQGNNHERVVKGAPAKTTQPPQRTARGGGGGNYRDDRDDRRPLRRCEDSLRLHPRTYGWIIGKNGATLRNIESRSRCRVTMPPRGEERIYIEGSNREDVEFARNLIFDVLDEAEENNRH